MLASLFKGLAALAGEIFSRWLGQLNLKKQGASEQREVDAEERNEKLREAIDAHKRHELNESHGVRDEDYRD